MEGGGGYNWCLNCWKNSLPISQSLFLLDFILLSCAFVVLTFNFSSTFFDGLIAGNFVVFNLAGGSRLDFSMFGLALSFSLSAFDEYVST